VQQGLLTFPPDPSCPSTALSTHDGSVATGQPVYLVFWGTDWEVAHAFTRAAQAILAGPYMSGLRQYGVGRTGYGDRRFIFDPEPPFLPDEFTKGDVVGVLEGAIESGGLPRPLDQQNLYIVFLPRNTHPKQVNGMEIGGEHSHFFMPDGIVWYAFVATNSFDEMIRSFTHELTEMCTDPENDGWKVYHGPTGCDEIADLCNSRTGPVSGVNNVDAYWSKHDNACIIPTAWTVRQALGWAGKTLNGKGLLSLQDPIPSLKKFIVNL
jgi:hypothetical protein